MNFSRESLKSAFKLLRLHGSQKLALNRSFAAFSALTSGTAAAIYFHKTYRSYSTTFSIVPQVSAHSANEQIDQSSLAANEVEENANDDPKISVMYDFFIEFASLEYEGVPYMTPADFIESLLEDGAKSPRQRRVLSARELRTLQKLAPPKGHASQRFFRDLGQYGIISYSEYLFLMHVLTKTDRSLRVAFQVLDVDGSGSIDKKELLFLQFLIDEEKRLARERAEREREQEEDRVGVEPAAQADWFVVKLFDRARSYATLTFDTYANRLGVSNSNPLEVETATESQDAADSNKVSDKVSTTKQKSASNRESEQLTRTYQVPSNTVDTTLLIHFFGKRGDDLLEYTDFSAFIENLQFEALEAEFIKYASQNCHVEKKSDNRKAHERGLIHVRDFARILFRHTEYARYCDVELINNEQHEESDEAGKPHDVVKSALERAKMVESSAHSLHTDFVLQLTSRLESLKPADRHITFEQFCRFHELFKHLDDLKVAVKLYGLQHTKITRSLFQRAFHAVTGHEIDPLLTEVLFKMFDVNQDGSLSHDEFLSVMRERVQRRVRGSDSHDKLEVSTLNGDHLQERLVSWDDFKTCLKSEIRKMK